MSYRDLRNLCEILRTIGYPRLVSIENFRAPNFPLVADIARWLVHQYDPKVEIPSSTDSETDRVTIVRIFAEFMLTKVQVKLNTKRLYQSDGYAVKELIKVASVIYTAVQSESEPNPSLFTPANPSSKEGLVDHARIDANELKETRERASQLVQKGVSLYDMLSKEVSLRDARNAALSKAYEYSEVERLIRAAIDAGSTEAKKMSAVIENVQSNLSSLESKIDKKQSELERSQKRLLTLKKVRPAFMDEFEELQKELSLTYKQYVDRFRSLSFLQNQIEEKHRVEMDRKAEERLNKADFANGSNRRFGSTDDYLYGPKGGSNGARAGGAFPLSSGSDEESSEDMDDPLTGVPPTANNSGGRSVVGVSGASKMVNGGRGGPANNTPRVQGRVYGSMMGGGEEESDEDESDMILVDGDNDNSDLGTEDDDEELVKMQKTLASEAALTNGGTLSKMGRLDADRPAMNGLRNGQHY